LRRIEKFHFVADFDESAKPAKTAMVTDAEKRIAVPRKNLLLSIMPVFYVCEQSAKIINDALKANIHAALQGIRRLFWQLSQERRTGEE
jgi:hypothetical protein